MNELIKKYAPLIGYFIFPNLRREMIEADQSSNTKALTPAHLRVSGHYRTDPETLFERASSFADVMDVTRGIASYEHLPAERMVEGKTYATNIRVLRLFKSSNFKIRIDRLCFKDRIVITHEGNRDVRSWRHKLEVKPSRSGAVWTDTLEIDAGLLTPVVSRFARFMYVRRHKKRGALTTHAVLGDSVIRTQTDGLEGHSAKAK